MGTFKSVWEKYSKVTLRREIYVKKLNFDGTYEASFSKISKQYTAATPISGIKRELSNTSWKFGAVTVGSCSFNIMNPYGNFSSEEFAGSIFTNYVRDRSQIKLVDYLLDPDDDNNPTTGETVFQGLIDSDRTFTRNILEFVTALDYLTVLKEINMVNVGFTDRVTNGKFDTDSNWIKGIGWTIDGGVAKVIPSAGGDIEQPLRLIVGEEYTIYYKISGFIAGTVTADLGGTSDSARTTDGEFSFTHTATSTTQTLKFTGNAAADMNLDNVKVVRLVTVAVGVYEIMNRSEFTKFFSVSASTTYINPPVDYTVDFSLYTGTVFECFQNIAQGMSIFYINPSDNYFYFKDVTPTPAVQHSFLVQNNRKKDIRNVKEGTDRVYNDVYFSDTEISSESAVKTRTKPINITIDGVVTDADRLAIVVYIREQHETKKQYFTVELPYAPFIFILDRLVIQSFGQAPVNAARWGFFNWLNFVWTKAVGIKVNSNDNWLTRRILHDGKLSTILEVEKIL